MTIGVNAKAILVGGARVLFGSGILLLVLAIVFAPAFAAAPPARDVPKGNPRLASLQIEIWPEFDRPAAALVILKGEIAAGVRLPAAVTLRIAARTGGPTAVAYSAESDGDLLKMNYDHNDSDDYIALKFNAPDRFFHIEFYDLLTATTPNRNYTYVWNGDLATEQLRVILQEPAAASGMLVQPPLADTAVDPDGLRYHSAELGAQEAGKSLPIKVSYTKTGVRTSAEILGQKIPDATAAPAAGSSLAPAPVGGSNDELMKGVLIFIVPVSLLIAAGSALLWWRGRAKIQPAKASGARFCRKCGSPSASGDKFCSKCGSHLG